MSKVSSKRGRVRGRPETAGRARLEGRMVGRGRGAKAGEPVGEADIRMSWSLLSSSAFRLRLLDGCEGVDTSSTGSQHPYFPDIIQIANPTRMIGNREARTGTRGREAGMFIEVRRNRRSGHQAVHDDCSGRMAKIQQLKRSLQATGSRGGVGEEGSGPRPG